MTWDIISNVYTQPKPRDLLAIRLKEKTMTSKDFWCRQTYGNLKNTAMDLVDSINNKLKHTEEYRLIKKWIKKTWPMVKQTM